MNSDSSESLQWTKRPNATARGVPDTDSMFRLLFERSADAMTLQDPETGIFQDVNEASVRLTAAPGKNALLGSNPGIISPERQPDGALSADKVREVIGLAMARGSHRFEWVINRFDGTQLPVEIVLTVIRSGETPLLLSVSRDITERKRTELELRENQQLLVSVADNISEAIYRTGPHHELIFANRAYLRMSGYELFEEIRSVPREKLYAKPSDRTHLLDLLTRFGMFRNEEIEYVRRDGTHWWGLTNSLAIHDETSGKVLYHVGSVADITERKRAADEIRKLNATLERRIAERTAELTASEAELLKSLAREKELSQLKSNFVSMVSHEFRTPLGVIMSSAEILENYLDQLEPGDRKDQLESIRKNTRRMADLMEEVLVLGMAEAGKLDFKPEPLDFSSFCRRLVEELQSATHYRCPVQISAPTDLNEAHADERLLQHIFSNLLSNAVKYSTPGSMVHFEIERDGIGQAICRIRDHGMGIPEADITRLFSAFYRGENASHVPGTGLGLSIVKRCVELHRGKIRVESVLGSGTTVTVQLPLFVMLKDL